MKRLIFVLMIVASTIGCLITIHSVSAQTPGVTGFPICTNSSTQTDPVIDGDIVVWLDQRSGHIHLYGYDLSTATEFPICTTGYQQGRAGISGDIVVWEELRNGTNDIYGYNISTGVEFPICTEPTMPQVFPAISEEIVVWEDERNGDGNGDIYAYNLSSGGTFTVCTNLSDQDFPAVSGDIVVWTDRRNGNSDIYGYNLSSGVEFPICTNASVQMGSDISGNIVVWTDTRNGKEDIYGYNLSNGVEFPICINASYQWNAAISGDIVVWYDNRWEEYFSDVYGYNLSSGTEFPIIVASSSGQYAPDVSGDVVVWYDTRTGNYDIYGATLNWNPPSEVWVDDDYSLGACGVHTWGYDAFNKIQDGIDAVSGSIVHVAEGTYFENIVLKDGVELLGAGSDTTIIDGMQNGSVVTAINCGNTTKLEGFDVINGSGSLANWNNGFYTFSGVFGGGIYNNCSLATVTNCVFENNINSGMCNLYSSPTILNCTFINNSACAGGGMCNLNSSPIITNCIFWKNTGCQMTGGGIYNAYSSPTITNCDFISNQAECCGDCGGCPFTGDGGGMATHSGIPVVTNCVFWNNGALLADPGTIQIAGSALVTYSDIEDGYTGTGNINSDPMFANISAGDFHLGAGSPCIDAGSNSAPSLPTLDYEGDPRIFPSWGTVDMGVDEYIHPAPSCDSWDVQYRIVGGQITMNYSAAGITPVKKIVPLSEEHGGYMTFKFCKEADNGSRLVVIPQDSWYMETILVENVMTGIDMDLSIRLDSDASGILYVDDSIGDVDVSSESVSGRTPVQIDTIGDGTKDAAGSMLIPMTLVGDFNTSVGQSGELPFGMTFTTGNTTNVAHIPINPKMDGATMSSEGVPFAEEGGVAPYAGTNGTITATGTGDCLGIRLVGIRIDFQFEMKLELEPVRTADVNYDGSINVLDMIRIGQHWGQTGSESWIPEDVNSDGTINVLDMIVIGQNWTG